MKHFRLTAYQSIGYIVSDIFIQEIHDDGKRKHKASDFGGGTGFVFGAGIRGYVHVADCGSGWDS